MLLAKDLMTKDYISVDVKNTVSEYIGKVNSRKKSFALVFDGKKYLGIVSKNWLLTSRIDASVMKLSNILKHRSKSKIPFFVPKLSKETPFDEICRLMATSDVNELPVLEKDKVVGVVESEALLSELKPLYKKVKCSEISPKFLISVSKNTALGQALNIMSLKNIGHLPVVDASNKLVGILSLIDFFSLQGFIRKKVGIPRSASHQQGKKTGFGVGEVQDLLKLPVDNIIQHFPMVCVCSPDENVSCAIDIMLKECTCNVVLVKNDSPVGILTARDVLLDYTKS